jgi:hypothetical protein
MRTHVRERQFLFEGAVGSRYIFEQALADCIVDPVGYIVQAGGVSVYFSVTIADALQIAGEIAFLHFVSLLRAEGHCQCIFNESGTIHFVTIDNKVFCVIYFQGACLYGPTALPMITG